MVEERPKIEFAKSDATIVLSIPVIVVWYYVYVSITAVPLLTKMFEDLGQSGMLPGLTRVLVATNRFWALIGIVLTALVIDFARRERPSSRHCSLLFVGSCITALLLHIIATEGTIMPIFQLMERIGG